MKQIGIQDQANKLYHELYNKILNEYNNALSDNTPLLIIMPEATGNITSYIASLMVIDIAKKIGFNNFFSQLNKKQIKNYTEGSGQKYGHGIRLNFAKETLKLISNEEPKQYSYPKTTSIVDFAKYLAELEDKIIEKNKVMRNNIYSSIKNSKPKGSLCLTPFINLQGLIEKKSPLNCFKLLTINLTPEEFKNTKDKDDTNDVKVSLLQIDEIKIKSDSENNSKNNDEKRIINRQKSNVTIELSQMQVINSLEERVLMHAATYENKKISQEQEFWIKAKNYITRRRFKNNFDSQYNIISPDLTPFKELQRGNFKEALEIVKKASINCMNNFSNVADNSKTKAQNKPRIL